MNGILSKRAQAVLLVQMKPSLAAVGCDVIRCLSAHTSLLVQLVKLCSGMIEAGKAYITTNKHFVSGVRDLSQQCKKDEMISVSHPGECRMGHSEG